jgi:deoxyguanosine kinase
MKYNFITIEGNIGAGKTTLAHLLSKHYNARLVLEEFADNPFLPKFYENPAQPNGTNSKRTCCSRRICFST